MLLDQARDSSKQGRRHGQKVEPVAGLAAFERRQLAVAGEGEDDRVCAQSADADGDPALRRVAGVAADEGGLEEGEKTPLGRMPAL